MTLRELDEAITAAEAAGGSESRRFVVRVARQRFDNAIVGRGNTVYGYDLPISLRLVVENIGLPPTEVEFPTGDLHFPLIPDYVEIWRSRYEPRGFRINEYTEPASRQAVESWGCDSWLERRGWQYL